MGFYLYIPPFDTRGEIIIRELWEQQNNDTISVKLRYTDADTYRFDPMENILDCWEKMNKDKQGNHFHEKRKHFSLFVISVAGMIGKEDLVVLVNLSRLVAAKMDEPILHVRDWINGRIAVAVVMSYSQTILGY